MRAVAQELVADFIVMPLAVVAIVFGVLLIHFATAP